MFGEDFIQRAIIAAPAILFALTVHEYFHAYLALKFGDTTARDMGRLTLNPLAHLDFFGTLMMFMSQFRFGWAKPVPVNPFNLRNPRVADFWISAAGPFSNLGLGLVFGLLFRLLGGLQMQLPEAFYMFLFYSVMINVSLAFFNLIPLFPLDGSHILRSVLPPDYGPTLDQLDRFSPFILIILIVMGGFWLILGPFIRFFVHLFSGIQIG
ncbi:MAG: site-2 protease family protein [Candidatus Zixiibacteriota bacterium]|nr:MAG: site-2 protease family protein [candidate division Zixibacteria bacterium]